MGIQSCHWCGLEQKWRMAVGRRPEAAHPASPREDAPGRGTKGAPTFLASHLPGPPPTPVLGMSPVAGLQGPDPPTRPRSQQAVLKGLVARPLYISKNHREEWKGGSRDKGHTHTPNTHTRTHKLPCSSDGKEICLQCRRPRFDPLEKEMTTNCSILAWRIPWTKEPDELLSGVAKSRTQLSD